MIHRIFNHIVPFNAYSEWMIPRFWFTRLVQRSTLQLTGPTTTLRCESGSGERAQTAQKRLSLTLTSNIPLQPHLSNNYRHLGLFLGTHEREHFGQGTPHTQFTRNQQQ